MDESSFENEAIRIYGYALIGTPYIDSDHCQVKKHTNAIGALYEKTLFVIDYLE